jgi:hypothetical protein
VKQLSLLERPLLAQSGSRSVTNQIERVRTRPAGQKKFFHGETFLLPKPGRFSIIFAAMEIMKPLTLSSCRKYLVLCGVVAAAWPVFASDIVLQKAPPFTVEQVPFYPENLARYHFGADVKATPQSSSTAKLQLSVNGVYRNTS